MELLLFGPSQADGAIREHGSSDANFYNWKAKDDGMEDSEKALKVETDKPKKLLAEPMLDPAALP